jgi:hypothetical protein
MTTIKPVFVELKRPSGNHPGHVLEGFFTVENVRLVDRDGAAVKDAPGGNVFTQADRK